MPAAPGGVRGDEGPEGADSSAPSAAPAELANAATAPTAADRCNSSLRFMVLPSPCGLLVTRWVRVPMIIQRTINGDAAGCSE